jgi:hypothetical protein
MGGEIEGRLCRHCLHNLGWIRQIKEPHLEQITTSESSTESLAQILRQSFHQLLAVILRALLSSLLVLDDPLPDSQYVAVMIALTERAAARRASRSRSTTPSRIAS